MLNLSSLQEERQCSIFECGRQVLYILRLPFFDETAVGFNLLPSYSCSQIHLIDPVFLPMNLHPNFSSLTACAVHVLGLKAVSVSTRETWIWLKQWLKVELILFRIKYVVFACFLPVLTGWLIRFFCIVLPYVTMSLQFCAKINVV